jgi:hypothetical protein
VPPVQNPAAAALPLRLTKRYTGSSPPSGPGETTTGEPQPPGTTTTGPPEWPWAPPTCPPYVPVREGPCDCCCYTDLRWTLGNPISADIVVPAAAAVDVPLGGQLPLAAEARDSDLLIVHCEIKGCLHDPCPPCESKLELQMADRVRFHWRIVSGEGALQSRPHLHSNEAAAAAAIFVAPDAMPADPKVVVELTVDDSPEKLTDVDDAEVKKQLAIRLVPKAADPDFGPKSLPPEPVITPSPGPCPCSPKYRWTAGAALKGEIALPKFVCEKGFAVLSAPGFDSDLLTANCSGGCSTAADESLRNLIDPLVYTWQASNGRILGGWREEVIYKPLGPGFAGIKVRVGDSSTQYGDPALDLEGSLTVVGIEPKESGDYIVPFSRDNVVRYQIRPGDLAADQVILEVLDKEGRVVRRLDDLPKQNGAGGFAEYKWDGLTEFKTPLAEKGSPYAYRLTEVKGEARCRAEVQERKVKEWDFVYRISDRGQAGGGAGSGASGIDLKTVTPALVETHVEPQAGDKAQVPAYGVEERVVDANDKRALVTLLRSYAAGDKFFVYTSPTAPNRIKYTVTVKSREGGALDRAGNEWDMDPAKAGVQRTQIWTFIVNDKGELTDFKEEIKD